MDAVEIVLLYDYYGDLLTDRQKECFEMRYYQDFSLGILNAASVVYYISIAAMFNFFTVISIEKRRW